MVMIFPTEKQVVSILKQMSEIAEPMSKEDISRRRVEGLKLHYQYKEWEALLHKLNELPYWPETG